MMVRRVLLGLGVALVLADGSIVSLALPRMLVSLHTTVLGVAAVLFVYMAVLAAAVLAGAAATARFGVRRLVCAGFVVVMVAGLVCALANSLDVILLGRGLGAVGGGVAVVGSFDALQGDGRGRHAWRLASVLGVAVGPALGGALTQAFAWRAIFIAQIPLAGAAAVIASTWPVPGATAGTRSRQPQGRLIAARSAVSLGLVSGALSAVLFLLVLEIIVGWDISPLRAAVAVSVLPIAALAGAAAKGSAQLRATAGCALVGSGVLALAWIPQPNLAWTLAPQLLAGLGAGLAIPALSGELLPQNTAREAGRLLGVRHVGIALVLVALAPLISHQLSTATRHAQLQGIALMLDADLSPQQKLLLAPPLYAAVSSENPRSSLHTAFAAHQGQFSGTRLTAYHQLESRSENVLTDIVQRGFRSAFVIAGLLALLAAILLATMPPGGLARRSGPSNPLCLGRLRTSLARVLVVTVALPAAYVAGAAILAPAPVKLADPCTGGSLPHSGGISGFLQEHALQLLDDAACRLHTSREELVLALASPAESHHFATSHDGVNPRSILEPLIKLLKL